MTPKQMGRLGLFHIEQAILEVLSEEPEGLQPADISRSIGIIGYNDPDLALRYALVWGALIQMKTKGLVEKFDPDSPRWKLTPIAERMMLT